MITNDVCTEIKIQFFSGYFELPTNRKAYKLNHIKIVPTLSNVTEKKNDNYKHR